VATLKLYELLKRRALITRESADTIREAVTASIGSNGEVTLDFSGVDAVTPSFVDEVLGIIDDASDQTGRTALRVVFLNAPTRLSAKFAAIGRGHGARMIEADSGSWEITRQTPP
jgi:hypothetical protein